MTTLYESIMNNIRAQATGIKQSAQSVFNDSSAAPASPSSPGVGSVDSSMAMATGEFNSPFMSDSGGAYDAKGNLVAFGQQSFNDVSNAEAAAKAHMGTYGMFDVTDDSLFGGRNLNRAVQFFSPSMLPGLGLSSLFSGTTTVDPYGKTTAKPGGLFGFMATKNIENQYEIANEIAKGTPGYHQFYSAGNLVGITPGLLGFTVSGTFNGTAQDAINQYSAMLGYDPKTVDMNKSPDTPAFGERLGGFVAFSGGFDKEGNFVNAAGVTDNAPMSIDSLTAHLGLVNEFVGTNQALNALSQANVDASVKDSLMSAIENGELTAQTVTNSKGEVVGYATAMGGAMQNAFDSQGNPIGTGAGYVSKAAIENWAASLGTPGVDAQMPGDWSGNADSGYMGAGPDTGFAGISPSDFSFGVDLSDDVDDNESYTASDPGSSDYGMASNDDFGFDDGSFGGMARGGYAMAEGGPTPAVLNNPEQTETAGFVDRPPEQVSEAESVADNVPADVEEGTFVLNAPAVEFMGSEDVKKMLIEATDEAERQGVDIVQNNTKMDKKKLLSLVVSKGEVLIPPVLAKIIGYDRLEKINNRGKQEVERRIAENGQDIPPEAQQTASDGGTQNSVADTEVIDVYRSIVSQGGDAGRFQVFEKAFREYQKGKAYRPMQSEIGTPEFDEEVRRKYGYAFPETEGGIFATKDRDAPLAKTKKKVSKPDSGEGFVPAP